MRYSVSKDQIRTLVTCETKTAESAIKEAAKTKDEDLYQQIVSVDLIAKEFRYHAICYNDFTKPTSNSSNVNTQSDFEKVVEFISENVLNGQQAVSMKTLTQLYNNEQAHDRRYRDKLKERIIKRYIILLFNPCYRISLIDQRESEVGVNIRGN